MTINGGDILSVQMSDGFDPFIGAISYGITLTNIPCVTRSGAIVTIDPAATLSLANIQATTGTATGVALAVSFTGNPNIGATSPPGRGRNLDGRVTGLAAYAGNLHSTNIVRSSLFINSGVTASIALTGLVANASYEIGMVGSRTATGARNTVLTINGAATIWDISEYPPLERRVTVTATAGGAITAVLSTGAANTYAYIGGISIRWVS